MTDFIEYWDKEKTKIKTIYKKYNKNKRKCLSYYLNGELEEEITYINGRRRKRELWYGIDNKPNVLFKTFFWDENGKKHGRCQTWFGNAIGDQKRWKDYNYVHGLKHGTCTTWSSSNHNFGDLESVCVYENGKLMRQKEY